MKILQVVSFFKPSWEAGGIARVCYEISKKLADKGHEVTIYTTDGFKSRLKVKKNQPVNVENMNVYYLRNLSNFLAKRNLCIPYLLPYLSKRDLRQFDVIHVREEEYQWKDHESVRIKERIKQLKIVDRK